jgi:hypothetical protein
MYNVAGCLVIPPTLLHQNEQSRVLVTLPFVLDDPGLTASVSRATIFVVPGCV